MANENEAIGNEGAGEPERGRRVEPGRARPRAELFQRARESGRRAGHRAGTAAGRQKGRLASRLDRAGERLRDRGRSLESQSGIKRRAGRTAERAGTAMHRGAAYLRTHDAGEMRTDLEHRVRERPLASVGLAVGLGYLIGRIIR